MIGSRLGKWIIDRELGRGGMGSVYLAHEEAEGIQAAVKVLAPELAQETGFLDRFQREIDVLSRLNHPNIVRFYESGIEEGKYYYAMEYIEGDSFEQLLIDRGRLPWNEVLDAALQICPALKHAHDRGVVHRDLKPPNLLLAPNGVVKLTDFGIAKVFAGRQLTRTGGVVGTAEYLSPEQASGKQATKRSDLYSLGVVLYTLLTGQTPFQGTTTADILHKHLYAQFDRPRKRVPEIPYELDEIVCQLMEKDPARRPADGLVLQKQLDSIRRRLERKAQATALEVHREGTLADNSTEEELVGGPGPATLMSQLMRKELEKQKYGGSLSQWVNRPWVVLPLFLIVVGVLVWHFGFQPGKPTDDPENVATVPESSEAQRFYQRGLRLQRDGETEKARQIWQSIVHAFAGVPGEERWVKRAQQRLDELGPEPAANPSSRDSIKTALQNAQDAADRAEAEKIWQALATLYPDDAWVQEQIKVGRAKRKP
jgi:serine/threonine-protein kinase